MKTFNNRPYTGAGGIKTQRRAFACELSPSRRGRMTIGNYSPKKTNEK